MTNPTLYQPDAAKLARLKRRLKRRGITQIAVAARAGVTKVHVCNVLNGRDPSAPVLRAAKELIAESLDAQRSMAPAEPALAGNGRA